MEGRAIARPNADGGYGAETTQWVLQWRAGQLPGRTLAQPLPTGVPLVPSMEGRAIARPNR